MIHTLTYRFWVWAANRIQRMVTAALGPAVPPPTGAARAARTAPLDPDLHALIRELIE